MTKKEVLHDLKTGIIMATLIVPFPFLGLFSAPWWAWGLYVAWWGLILYANTRRPHRKARKTKIDRVFQPFQIEDEEGAA